jgi:hypothetical protein
MTAANTRTARRSNSLTAIILCSAAILLAWGWFAMALGEAYDEECKARMAGTSEVGFAVLFGVVPLVLVSVGALVAILVTAGGSALRRLVFGVGVLFAATAAGVLFAWAFSGWTLITHFAIGTNCYS